MDLRAGLLATTVALLILVAGCNSSNIYTPVPQPTPMPTPSGGPAPTPSPTLAPFAVSPSSLTFNAATSSTQALTVSDPLPGSLTLAGCSGIVSTSISGGTISVTPLAGGSCTLTITDEVFRSVGVSITVTAVSVPVE